MRARVATRRLWREYVRAYCDLLEIASRWLPPLRWHVDFYRAARSLRRDVLGGAR